MIHINALFGRPSTSLVSTIRRGELQAKPSPTQGETVKMKSFAESSKGTRDSNNITKIPDKAPTRVEPKRTHTNHNIKGSIVEQCLASETDSQHKTENMEAVQALSFPESSKLELEKILRSESQKAADQRRMAMDQRNEGFCQVCNKEVGKVNMESHIKGKDHCKKKRWREDKERLQNESKSAKSLSATGLKRPNTKGQARNTLEKKSKSKHVTPIFSANSRAPQGSVQFGKEDETKPLQMNYKVESKDEAVDRKKITWLPPTDQTQKLMQKGTTISGSEAVTRISSQTVEDIKKQKEQRKTDDLAASLKMYAQPPPGFEEEKDNRGGSSLHEILEYLDSLEDDRGVPREMARALDQGLAETCTTHAVANACAEDLHPDIDVSLDELVGALKQGAQVDIWNGNNVEDFDGHRLTNIMDRGGSKVYGDIVIKAERLTKENSKNKKGKHLLVYLRKENDPNTMHCVFVKRFHLCKNNSTLKEDLCEAINSWGDLNPKLYIPIRQKGNRFYKVTAEWTQVGPVEDLTSDLLPPASNSIKTTEDCPRPTSEIAAENETTVGWMGWFQTIFDR